MPTTSNFGWTTPADTDLVKDGAAAIRTLGNGIDTSFLDLKGGTTGQVLSKASNTDLDFSWVAQDDSNAIQNAIVDAKGDLISATAADTPARLAVGANDTVLTADSSTATGLKWAAPASGGMTVIASGTESSVATFTISSIPSGYVNLFLLMRSYTTAADNFEAYVRFNGDTGTNYNYASATSQGATAFGSSFIALGDGTDANNTKSLHQLTIYDYSNTVTWKMLQGNQVVADPTTATSMRYKYSNGFWNNTNAITSITITNGGSNLSVSYILYGVK